jgi:hypothetical protein
MTVSIKTFSITALSIMGLFATLCINDIYHNKTAIMLSVVMLSVVRLSVVMLSVIMLSVAL